jgi:hypothetical protein
MATTQEAKTLKAKEIDFELMCVLLSVVGFFIAYSKYKVKKQQQQ